MSEHQSTEEEKIKNIKEQLEIGEEPLNHSDQLDVKESEELNANSEYKVSPTREKVDYAVETASNKVVEVVLGSTTFIQSFTNYITNNYEEFKDTIVKTCAYLTGVFLAFEFILFYFNINSVIGIIPKLFTLIIFITVFKIEDIKKFIGGK